MSKKNSLYGKDPFEMEWVHVETIDGKDVKYMFQTDHYDGLSLQGIATYQDKPMFFMLEDFEDVPLDEVSEEKRAWKVRWVKCTYGLYELTPEKLACFMSYKEFFEPLNYYWPSEEDPVREKAIALDDAIEIDSDDLVKYHKVGTFTWG